eukprot:SAG31_NODE_45085_length_260_cov_0.645963_2_plen_46_part_01
MRSSCEPFQAVHPRSPAAHVLSHRNIRWPRAAADPTEKAMQSLLAR